jgi:hypothetical protein
VLDIKPYVPYADAIDDAINPLAPQPPEAIAVTWTDAAREEAQQHQDRLRQPLVALIEQCLSQDPKPAYQQPAPDREYGVQLWDVNVRWHYPHSDQIRILGVRQATLA